MTRPLTPGELANRDQLAAQCRAYAEVAWVFYVEFVAVGFAADEALELTMHAFESGQGCESS